MKLNGIYFGIVKDNQDPKGLGRCKIAIQGLTDELKKEQQPWFSQIAPIMYGGVSGQGYFSVPSIDSQVVCGFLNDDITQGFYFGYFVLNSTKVIENQNDKMSVYRDPAGNQFITNLNKDSNEYGTIEITLAKDIKKQTSGNIITEITGNEDTTITGNSTENVNGNITINADGNITINGKNGVTIQSNSSINIEATSDISIQANGNANITAMTGCNIQSPANVSIQSSGIVSLQGSAISLN